MYENCPVFELEGECYEDRHHVYWPASQYGTRVERQFRQLDENKVLICRWIHNTIHGVALPPQKPTRNKMLEAMHNEHKKRNN